MAGFSVNAPFHWTDGSLRLSGVKLTGQRVTLQGATSGKLSAGEIAADADVVEKTGTLPLKTRGVSGNPGRQFRKR